VQQHEQLSHHGPQAAPVTRVHSIHGQRHLPEQVARVRACVRACMRKLATLTAQLFLWSVNCSSGVFVMTRSMMSVRDDTIITQCVRDDTLTLPRVCA
jgi:hypothetical protein